MRSTESAVILASGTLALILADATAALADLPTWVWIAVGFVVGFVGPRIVTGSLGRTA